MLPTQVLKIRAFRDLWLGQAISQFGDAFYYVIFAFMVQKITGSAAMVGFTGAFEALPFLLFSAYAGVLADKLDRRKIMLLSDLLSGVLLLAFAAVIFTSMKPPIWTIFTTAFLTSTVRAFFLPAKNASIPSLVPADILMKANAFSGMTQSFMPLLGLAFSASVLGLLYSLSQKWFFLSAIIVNASSFFGSAFFIAKLPSIIAERNEVRHPWTDFVLGMRYIRERNVLFTQLCLSVLVNLSISPFFVVYVIANNQWFGGKPQTLTWCELTFFVGLIIGSAIVGKLKFRHPGIGYVISVTGVGAAVMTMGFCQNIWMFCAMNIVCGLVMPFAEIPFMTYTQLVVEDSFRGRVNSANNMLRAGIMPIGMSLGGILVKTIGVTGAFLMMGTGFILAAVIGLAIREFRLSTLPESTEMEPPLRLEAASEVSGVA